ncbi:class IIb bacteriocin, lactobin A/cerein 7B family [Pseudoduganella chitinolytica]|uniref:class IIb bacteriocin, lactobin A/cerein 7B family n=1 Tax=Pseudoduganella chitinolytica TaxID=34070 RepID=UPI0035309BE9
MGVEDNKQVVEKMVELSNVEVEAVSGGIVPLIGWAIGVRIGAVVGGAGLYLAKRWSCM